MFHLVPAKQSSPPSHRQDNFQRCLTTLLDSQKAARKRHKPATAPSMGRGGIALLNQAAGDTQSDIFKLTRMLVERGYGPVIVFAFSRKECEGLAAQLAAMDLNVTAEKKLVKGVYRAAVAVLSEADKKLP